MNKLSKGQFAGIIIALALGLSIISAAVIICINLIDLKDSKKDEKTKQQVNEVSYVASDTNYVIASDSNGDVWIQCYTKVTNTGSENLYLSTGKFNIKDETGQLVDAFSANPYPQVIAPGETAIYFESQKFGDEKLSGKYKQYNIDLKFDALKSKVPLIRYEVSGLSISISEIGYLAVRGNVTNTSTHSSYDCLVFVKVYDNEGNFIGIYDTYLTEEISPGETESFEIFALRYYFNIAPENVGTCVAVSYPYQYQFD